MVRQIRLAGILLIPSLLSGTTCIVVAIGFLLLINWPFVAHNALVHSYFFGPNGLVTAIKSTSFNPANMWHTLFAHPLSRNVLTYLFILSITLVLYTVLEASSHAFADVSNTFGDLQTARRRRFRLLTRELWERMIVRIVTAAAWLLYLVIFMRLILPVCISHTRYGIATIDQLQHLPDLLLGIVVLFFALHVHVILARLLTLRPRIFGGLEILLNLENEHGL